MIDNWDDEPAFYVSELSANTIKLTSQINGKTQFSKQPTAECVVPVYWERIVARKQTDELPVGYWQGQYGDGSATLYEVPQESAFGRTYPNYPLYAGPTKQVDHTRDELEHFMVAFDNAKANGLQYEFMEFFLQDYQRNHSIDEAVWYAECEWDL